MGKTHGRRIPDPLYCHSSTLLPPYSDDRNKFKNIHIGFVFFMLHISNPNLSFIALANVTHLQIRSLHPESGKIYMELRSLLAASGMTWNNLFNLSEIWFSYIQNNSAVLLYAKFK